MLAIRNCAIAVFATAAVALAGAALAMAPIKANLTGGQEVPKVQTSAKGDANIMVQDDGAVSGSVKTSGIKGTAAHIHVAPEGQNGPPIIPLQQKSDNEWVVPAGSKLTKEQMQQLKDGMLYVNVHSAKHQDGEIRAQLKQVD
jgi:hypothetical protein